MSTLYDRLGGQEGIARVVDTFYDRVLADPRVSSFFARTDMERQRRHQTLFLSHVTGGRHDPGRSIREAHRGLGIRREHFDIIVEHLVQALTAHGVAPGDMAAVLAALAPLRDDVVEEPPARAGAGRVGGRAAEG